MRKNEKVGVHLEDELQDSTEWPSMSPSFQMVSIFMHVPSCFLRITHHVSRITFYVSFRVRVCIAGMEDAGKHSFWHFRIVAVMIQQALLLNFRVHPPGLCDLFPRLSKPTSIGHRECEICPVHRIIGIFADDMIKDAKRLFGHPHIAVTNPKL